MSPRSRQEVKSDAWKLATMRGFGQAFGEEGPTDGWLHKFLMRYSDLTMRKPEALSNAAATVNLRDIKKWYDNIGNKLREKDPELLNDASRWFNMDESGFETHPQKNSVVSQKGSKQVVYLQKNKETMTVSFTFSAEGTVLKPYVLFKGRRKTSDLKKSISPETHVELSDSGWQNGDSFSRFIDFFTTELDANNVKRPVVLVVDGHPSHDTLEVVFYDFFVCSTF